MTIAENRGLSYGSKVKIGERVVYRVGPNAGAQATLTKTRHNDYYWASPEWQVKWDDDDVASKMGNTTWYKKTDFGYLKDQTPPKAKGGLIFPTPITKARPVVLEELKHGDRLRVKHDVDERKTKPLTHGQYVEYIGPASWGGRIRVRNYDGYGFLPEHFEYVNAPVAEDPEAFVNALFLAKVKAMDEGIEEIRKTMLNSIKTELNRKYNIRIKD